MFAVVTSSFLYPDSYSINKTTIMDEYIMPFVKAAGFMVGIPMLFFVVWHIVKDAFCQKDGDRD